MNFAFAAVLAAPGLAIGSFLNVVAARLPEVTVEALRRRFPSAAERLDWPPAVADAIAGIQALLRGEMHDLRGIVLDERGLPAFLDWVASETAGDR